jgi:hypothetical protein
MTVQIRGRPRAEVAAARRFPGMDLAAAVRTLHKQRGTLKGVAAELLSRYGLRLSPGTIRRILGN